jgi:uncharacterized protein (AIM24 family)
MEFEIQGGTMPAVICKLQPGESMYTESGGMGWMTANIEMTTNMEGGLFGGFARKIAGESMFMTIYTCRAGIGTIAFPSSFPGSLLAFDLAPGQVLICQKKSFLCAQKTVQLEAYFVAAALLPCKDIRNNMDRINKAGFISVLILSRLSMSYSLSLK